MRKRAKTLAPLRFSETNASDGARLPDVVVVVVVVVVTVVVVDVTVAEAARDDSGGPAGAVGRDERPQPVTDVSVAGRRVVCARCSLRC